MPRPTRFEARMTPVWRTRGLVCLLVLCLGGTAAGCSLVRSVSRPARPVHPNVIGVALPLSGRYQAVGQAALQGIRLGLDPGKVTLVVKDTGAEPAQAVQVVEQLALEDGVVAILGGLGSEETLAMGKRADELGVTLLTLAKSPGVTSAGPYVFRAMLSPEESAEATARYARCVLGLKTVAVLAPQTDSGRQLTEAFRAALHALGGEITQEESYPEGQTSFRREAQALTGRLELENRADYQAAIRDVREHEKDPFRQRKAMEKVKSSLPAQVKFEGLFLPDGWETVSLIAPALAMEELVTNACKPEEAARVRKATGKARLETATLLGWSGWSSPVGPDGVPQLISRGGKFLECSAFSDGFFPASVRPAAQTLVRRFRKAHNGETPGLLHAVAYDSARLFGELLEKDKGADAAAFRDALSEVKDFDGATGRLAFSPERQVLRSLYALEVRGGVLQEVHKESVAAERCGGLALVP